MQWFWLISNRCYTTNLNEEPGIRLFWTTLWLIATSGIHRVLEYSIRYSIEYSSSKKLDSHSPTRMHHILACHGAHDAHQSSPRLYNRLGTWMPLRHVHFWNYIIIYHHHQQLHQLHSSLCKCYLTRFLYRCSVFTRRPNVIFPKEMIEIPSLLTAAFIECPKFVHFPVSSVVWEHRWISPTAIQKNLPNVYRHDMGQPSLFYAWRLISSGGI